MVLLRFFVSFLFLGIMSCASSKIIDDSKKMEEVSKIRIYDDFELKDKKQNVLGRVTGKFCQESNLTKKPIQKAQTLLKIEAYKLGAEGIKTVECVRAKSKLTTHCWRYITCTGFAFKFSN